VSASTFEPERYELHAGPRYSFRPSRREVLRALGGGLLVVCIVRDLAAQESGRGGRREERDEADTIGAWLHVGASGEITAFSGKAEVGQNARTSMAQVVAEELRVSIEAVRVVMGDTRLTPYDRGTFGSRTTPALVPRLRRAAAAAREMLAREAAARWGVERASLEVAGGRVLEPGGRSASFGELTEGRELVENVADDAPTTAPADWQVCGKAARKVDGRSLVTGGHRFASDVVRPEMLHGVVLRPPAAGARQTRVNTTAAAATPGVVVVQDGDFVGVAAPDEHAARRALAAVEAEWETAPQVSHRELFEHLRETAVDSSRGGRSRQSTGSVDRALGSAERRLAETYTVAYIAHAPLEPRAAVAEWSDGKLAVWTGTQRPFGVRSELAEAFGLAEDDVHVVVPDTGSGYGGKHTGEAALEAARLARAAGRPVKVVWTREEEFTSAYLRPAGLIDVESGFAADGTIGAWRFHNYNSGSSALEPTYSFANTDLRFLRCDAPLRQGSYRALAATANHFARETHLDEVARALGLDPLALRLANLEDGRQIAVLEAAAGRFGWGSEPIEGRGVGLACGFEKGGYVATCAEVSLDRRDGIRVERLMSAFECGAILNLDGLENQVTGAVIQGLGGALFEAIEFEGGKVLNPRFSAYRVPRFGDVPFVETVLVDRPDLPSEGAGEAPIVAVAPAIGNAIFDLTGERRRGLPLLA